MLRAIAPLLLALALTGPLGAGYIDGNGPTAVAYLGWLMGLPVALLGYGMLNQIRDFAARVKSGEITIDPQTTLFFLAGGLNDGRRETDTTLANLRQQLQLLRELGGRHVTIALLPTKIPQFAAVGKRLDHESHPSTAVHRVVGKKLVEEIAAHRPAKP